MKNLLWLVGLAIVSCSVVSAQDAELPAPRSDDSFFGPVPNRQLQSDRDSSYERYETRQQRVVRNAALKAAQRRERMALNARMGYSPSRPPASTVPFMGSPLGPPSTLRVYPLLPGIAFNRFYRF